MLKGRAFSTIEIKALDDDKRTIEGIASTPTTDRVRDIVNPLGAKFELPLPFLWQHQHDKPIGNVVAAEPKKSGIEFRAQLEKTDEPGTLKDRLDEAWQSIKLRLVRAVSIGFQMLQWSFLDDGGLLIEEWDWYELSAVTIPANPEAVITTVKDIYGATETDLLRALDREARLREGVPDPELPALDDSLAAQGKKAVVVKLDPPARARAPVVIRKINPVRERT